MKEKNHQPKNDKTRQLENWKENPEGSYLTTSHGAKVNHTDDSLKAGTRGPTIMEDFHFREKMTHFDHERIPERVVHARGSAAHGYFESYGPIPELCKAKLFKDTSAKTPVFVRFSTVAGFRGSADTVRDARGFATKFYTEEGNWDLVANNMVGANLSGENEQGVVSHMGVVTVAGDANTDDFVQQFRAAILEHRHWDREEFKEEIPA